MKVQEENKVFRFLELPPELRNRIYYFVFDDNSDYTLNLRDAPKLFPKFAITATSRQIHKESFWLLERAKKTFWKAHSLTLFIGRSTSTYMDKMIVLKACAKLPADANIHYMSFEVSYSMNRPGLHATFGAKSCADGEVQWSVFLGLSNVYHTHSLRSYQQRLLQLVHGAFEEMQIERLEMDVEQKLSKAVGEMPGEELRVWKGLDLEMCVKTVRSIVH